MTHRCDDLFDAAMEGHAACVRKFVTYGVNPNAERRGNHMDINILCPRVFFWCISGRLLWHEPWRSLSKVYFSYLYNTYYFARVLFGSLQRCYNIIMVPRNIYIIKYVARVYYYIISVFYILYVPLCTIMYLIWGPSSCWQERSDGRERSERPERSVNHRPRHWRAVPAKRKARVLPKNRFWARWYPCRY